MGGRTNWTSRDPTSLRVCSFRGGGGGADGGWNSRATELIFICMLSTLRSVRGLFPVLFTLLHVILLLLCSNRTCFRHKHDFLLRGPGWSRIPSRPPNAIIKWAPGTATSQSYKHLSLQVTLIIATHMHALCCGDGWVLCRIHAGTFNPLVTKLLELNLWGSGALWSL